MKRVVLIIAMIYMVACMILMPMTYKKIVREQRIDHPSHIKDNPSTVTFTGYVVQENLEKQWVLFKTDSGEHYQIRYKKLPEFAPLYFGKMKVVVSNQYAPYSGVKNFNGFDNDLRLFSEGVDGSFNLKSYEVVERQWTLAQWRLHFRRGLSEFIKNRCSEKLSGFYRALLLGDKSSFESYEQYMDFGLAHLFAISGLHFGLIYTMLHKTLWLGNHALKCLVIVLVLLLFLLWVGPSYSAMRAFLIIAYCLIGKCFHKNIDLVTALAISCLVILVIEPRAVLSTAFQMSFYAYLIIALILENGQSKVVQGLKIQGYLLPPSMFFFGKSHVLGFALNLIAIPAMGVLLPLALLHLIGLKVSMPILPSVLGRLIEMALGGFEHILKALPNVYVPHFLVKAVDYKWAVIGCMGILLLYIGYSTALKVKPYARRILWCLLMSVIVTDLLKSAFLLGTVSIVDVGHGDGAVLESKGNVFVIDLGDGYFDFASYLINRGIYEIDGLAISHAHKDHYGGLESLLEKITVKKLYINDETYEKVSEWVKPYSVEVVKVDSNRQVICGKMEIEITPYTSNSETNDNGLFIAMQLGVFDAYFTGDFSTFNLAQLKDIEKAELVKVPHHGSKTSVAPTFYKDSNPDIATVSHGMKYGLPDEEALEAIAPSTGALHSTYYDGELRIIVFPWHYTYKTFLKTMFYTP